MLDLAIVGLGLHLASVHGEDGFNNINPGIYLQAEINGEQWVAGTYYNSIKRQSAYVGWTYTEGPLGIEWTLGIITGYEKSPLPLVAPSYTFKLTEDTKARIVLLPNPFKPRQSALHLAVEWRF